MGDLADVVLYYNALINGQMQSLIGGVREECILSYLLGQWRAVQEIRMEQQCIGFRRRTVLDTVNGYGLAGSKAYHSLIIVIVHSLAIIDGASHGLFQKEGVESECHLMCVRLVLRTVEMHDADQRVLGMESEKPVVLLYCVCFYNIHVS